MQFTRFSVYIWQKLRQKKYCKSINATKQIDKKSTWTWNLCSALTYCCILKQSGGERERKNEEKRRIRVRERSQERKNGRNVCYFKRFISQKIWKLFCDRKFIVFVLEHGSCYMVGFFSWKHFFVHFEHAKFSN